MLEVLYRPWPWYVAGPVIGLFLPLLLLVGNRLFGISGNFRHACAALCPGDVAYFRYDWRAHAWNLCFGAGIVLGGVLAGIVFANPEPVAVSAATHESLAALGLTDFTGLVPREVFGWAAALTPAGLVFLVFGGFCVGLGTAWAGGCTSGHGIAGLADLQLPSLIAVISFFAGGIAATFLLLPLVLR
jgi:uncharacterized protein